MQVFCFVIVGEREERDVEQDKKASSPYMLVLHAAVIVIIIIFVVTGTRLSLRHWSLD